MSAVYRVENVVMTHDHDDEGEFATIACVSPFLPSVRVDLEELEEGVYHYSYSKHKFNGDMTVLSIEELLVRIAREFFCYCSREYQLMFKQIEDYTGYEDKQFRLDTFIEEKLAVFVATGAKVKFMGKPITYVVIEPNHARHDFYIHPHGEYELYDEEFARESLRNFLKWCKEQEEVLLNK